MVTDSHVHLDETRLASFVASYQRYDLALPKFTIITNSVDPRSSYANIEISKRIKNVHAFVGLHPQIFLESKYKQSIDDIEKSLNEVHDLSEFADGIGEVGLDSSYGEYDLQIIAFNNMLELTEKRKLPVCIHSRNSLHECLERLSTYDITSNVMFHWFSGNVEELNNLQNRGYYASFGPTILYSKRIQSVLEASDPNLTLAETDSPLPLESISKGFITNPFFVSSVIHKMSQVLSCSFTRMVETTDDNAKDYLETQT